MTKRQKYNAPSHEISVVWGHDRARFQILRDGKGTGAFATARSAAIGIAIREARQEALLAGLEVIVSSSLDGRRVVEWGSR